MSTITSRRVRPSTAARRAVLFGTPVATGVLLLIHPPDPTAAMELAGATGRWLAVHVGLLLPLLAVTLWLLLEGLRGPAATVSRLAVAAFAGSHAAWTGRSGDQLLVGHREDLVADRTRVENRLRWHLHDLDPERAAMLPTRHLEQRRVLDELAAGAVIRPSRHPRMTSRVCRSLRHLDAVVVRYRRQSSTLGC